MPSTYAHYRLGNDAAKYVNENLKKIIAENYESYALGLHGPDLLFYYKPLRMNEVSAKGYEIHEKPASEFFSAAKRIFENRSRPNADEAYLMGFLCHFALDSEAHPVVNAEMKSKNFTHTETESAFDKYLLEKDGKNAFGTDLTAHILNSARTRELAAAYFGITEKQASAAIRSIKYYNGLMNSRNRAKRTAVNLILKICGIWEPVHGMMLPLKTDERYGDAIRGLQNSYNAAVKKAAELMIDYDGFLRGEKSMSAKLERNFE